MALDTGEELHLKFAAGFSEDGFQMLEVDESLLEEMLVRAGEGVSGETGFAVRGKPDADAVLTSADKTFQIRLVESSNSQLLVSPPESEFAELPPESPSMEGSSSDDEDEEEDGGGGGGGGAPSRKRRKDNGAGSISIAPDDRCVSGATSSHLEVKQILPRLYQLQEALMEVPYGNDEAEQDMGLRVADETQVDEEDAVAGEDDDGHKLQKYTLEHLRCVVQASEAELQQGLRDLNALQVGKYWRLLAPAYAREVTNMVLNLLVEQDWPRTAVPVDAACHELSELYPGFVVRNVIAALLESGEAHGTVSLSDRKVQLFHLHCLFAERRVIRKDALLKAWASLLPDGLEPDETLLQGVALSVSRISGEEMHYCPVDALSQNAKTRFRELFEIREQWGADELAAYTNDLVPPGITPDAFLLKHTRIVQGDKPGEVKYISKFA